MMMTMIYIDETLTVQCRDAEMDDDRGPGHVVAASPPRKGYSGV